MHAFDRQTDRQTDRNLIVRPRLHSMQRGKNEVYKKMIIGDVVAHLKPKKFTVLSDL